MSAGIATDACALVVDDDPAVAKVLAAALGQQGIATTLAASAEEALRLLEARPFDVVVSDVRMPGASGMELLSIIHRRWRNLPVVLLTAHGTVPLAVEAMKNGAMDFITKPFDLDEVLAIVRRALVAAAPQRDKVPAAPSSGDRLETRSAAMREAESILARAADSDCTVLLLAESGAGKEVAARALHAMSARASKPFIAVHCAALPDNLLESELFGYERGAFTGATTRKPGRIELAEGGTFFLDEIGDISQATQVKLLRVLQEKSFQRLGGVATLKANVRFVAATHRDLAAMVRDGRFREDLYYRLSVLPVRLPPLRERPEDIIPLVEHFAKVHGAARGVTFDADALDLLAREPWPGNVRQLQNLVEHVVLLSDGARVTGDEARRALARQGGTASAFPPPASAVGVAGTSPMAAPGDITLEESRRDAERAALRKALERAGGNRTQAARILGVSRRTLYNKLEELGLA